MPTHAQTLFKTRPNRFSFIFCCSLFIRIVAASSASVEIVAAAIEMPWSGNERNFHAISKGRMGHAT